MKLNNKGFMLLEVVVVSTIIVTVLTSLYIGFSKLYKAYEDRNNYFDVDTIYALKNIEDMLIDSGVFNTILLEINNDHYKEFVKEGLAENDYIGSYIKKISNNYSLESIYITTYSSSSLDKIKNNSNDLEFNDFLIYLNKNLNFSEKYKYIFISKTKTGKFAYLRVI